MKIQFGDRVVGYAVNGGGCARSKLWGYWRLTDGSLAGPDYLGWTLAVALAELRTRTPSSTKNSVQHLCLQYCDYRILLSIFFARSHWTRID